MKALRFILALAGIAAIAIAVIAAAVLLSRAVWSELGELSYGWIARLGLVGCGMLLFAIMLRALPDFVRGFRKGWGR